MKSADQVVPTKRKKNCLVHKSDKMLCWYGNLQKRRPTSAADAKRVQSSVFGVDVSNVMPYGKSA